MGSDEPPCPAKWLKHWLVNLKGSMGKVGNTTLDSSNGILKGTGVLALVNSVQSVNVSCIIMRHLSSYSSALVSREFKPRLK